MPAIKIEKGEGKIDQVWEYFRMWSFVSVERPQHPWYPAHIVVTSKGERVPIGDFLNEDEKELNEKSVTVNQQFQRENCNSNHNNMSDPCVTIAIKSANKTPIDTSHIDGYYDDNEFPIDLYNINGDIEGKLLPF